MADMGDTLYRRMQLIGYCAGHMPDKLVWRWQGFNHDHKLRLEAITNGGADLHFRRDNDKKAALFAKNCRPIGKLRDAKQELIPPSGMPDSRWGFPSGPISDSMW